MDNERMSPTMPPTKKMKNKWRPSIILGSAKLKSYSSMILYYILCCGMASIDLKSIKKHRAVQYGNHLEFVD